MVSKIYSGILGALQSLQADAYLKGTFDAFRNLLYECYLKTKKYYLGEPDIIDEPWLQKSLPMKTESLWIGHKIEERNDFDYFDLIDNLNLGYDVMIGYLIAFISILIVSLSLSRFSMKSLRRSYDNKNLLFQLIYLLERLLKKKMFPFKVLLLSMSLFAFFTFLFLSINIKTNKVVVSNFEL